VTPWPDRLFHVADAMRVGVSAKELIRDDEDRPVWFLAQLERITGRRGDLTPATLPDAPR
jgi:hypothetical protein